MKMDCFYLQVAITALFTMLVWTMPAGIFAFLAGCCTGLAILRISRWLALALYAWKERP